jgi:hypothetical protein
MARSIGDLQDIVRAVKAKGASLKATEQPIDTSTAAGKCFLDMLGVFAEFETNLRKERQMEGIAKAKAAGVYRGRPPSVDCASANSTLVARPSTGRWRPTRVWFLFQSTIIFAVVASNIRWHWTPNGYLVAIIGAAATERLPAEVSPVPPSKLNAQWGRVSRWP